MAPSSNVELYAAIRRDVQGFAYLTPGTPRS